MAAIACLRVIVEAERAGLPAATLGRLVAKFASAYLETRWIWPRQFAPLTDFSFMLTDPRADELDVRELGRLSDELQVKLFGAEAVGDVKLLLFEGSLDAVTAFVTLDSATAVRALGDPRLLPPGGRLRQIHADGSAPEIAGEQASPAGAPDAAGTSRAARTSHVADGAEGPRGCLQGVYFAPKRIFVGDVIGLRHNWREHTSIVEGSDRLPTDPAAFDFDCIAAANRLLQDRTITTTLYVPISYDEIVRPSRRTVYQQWFSTLPAERRPQLAAVVYDVPRDPAFAALTQLIATLGTHFKSVDLRIDDPGFEVEKLTLRAVAGVSLALPNVEPRRRMSVLRHFTARGDHYRRRLIWASVTNVRTAEELKACAALGVAFVTGPTVSRPQLRPLAGRTHALDALPAIAG